MIASFAVSCLMPTRGRHQLLPRAVENFLAQSVPGAELLIVSEDGVPAILATAFATGRVRHAPCRPGLALGAKRNFACAAARGDLLVHWDDDDLHAPDRLARQVAALRDTGAAVCGSGRVLFRETSTGRCWEYRYGGDRPWVYGATLAYTRDYWKRHPFEALDAGEDNRFVWAADAGEVLDLDDPGLCLCAVHPGNTSPKDTGSPWWHAVELPPRWHGALAEAESWSASGRSR